MWDQAVLVFVTEDPQRDTQERMREYLDGIDPMIIGLTGSADELQPVWEAYYVGPEIISNAQQAEESGEHTHAVGDYTIAHTSRIYVIDRQSQLRLTFPGDTPVQDMVADVYHLIEEPTTKNQGG